MGWPSPCARQRPHTSRHLYQRTAARRTRACLGLWVRICTSLTFARLCVCALRLPARPPLARSGSILVIDDELPRVLLSQTDKTAIDNFAAEVGDKLTLLTIKRQGLAHAAVSFVSLSLMFGAGKAFSCDDIHISTLAMCTFTPFATRFAEELVTIPTRRAEARMQKMKSPTEHSAGAEEQMPTWAGPIASAMFDVVADATLAAAGILVMARLSIRLYMLP